jgi:hypothetical protein
VRGCNPAVIFVAIGQVCFIHSLGFVYFKLSEISSVQLGDGLHDESLVDVRNHTTASDGRLDERV